MKKLYIFNFLSIIVFNIIILIVSISQTFSVSIGFTVFYYFLLTVLLFLLGCYVNKKEIYKLNINIYILMYFICFISLTMFINRSGFGLINKDYFNYYINDINLIPFKTINEFLFVNFSFKGFIYNIFGNIVALIPLSLLLTIKSEKYHKFKNQFFVLSITVILIELLQIIFCTGRFDIDDYILNVGGALLFFFIINKTNINKFISSLFYKNYNIRKKLNFLIYIIVYFFIIYINISLLLGLFDSYKIYKIKESEKLYIVSKDICQNEENKNYENYIFNFNCLDVFYETKDGNQMDIIDAFKDKYLTIEKFENLLLENNFEYNEKSKTYSNDFDNIIISIYSGDINKINFSIDKKNN